jgi:hypothetical protein
MNKLEGPKSLAEWNHALVTAVFISSNGPRTSLSRIDTTGRLLTQITGDKVHESAKRRFIEAFGTDTADIRAHFKWSPSIPVITVRNGVPPTFAALYLTLLAASADDITYAEGNFRNRFAALFHNFVGLNDVNVNFIELPRLWQQVAGWSRQRAEKQNDCARLLLPDPKSETQIGYSKRLAFPTYRDEKNLRSLLSERKLSSDSDFKTVNDAIYSQLSTFSDSFREETATFNSLVARAQYQLAYASPLWGAVRDITWLEEDEKKQKDGRFCLQLDSSDPQSLELYLLTDETGAKLLEPGEKIALSRSHGDYTVVYQAAAGKTSITNVLSLNKRHLGISRSRVGKALQSGAIVLFPDVLGSLSSDGDYHDSGAACFLLRAEVATLLLRIFNHLGLRWSELDSPDVLGKWKGYQFNSLSKVCLHRISTELPDAAKQFIRKGWRPPQPRLSGGARYQQAILLTPASNPIVSMETADRGRYQLFGQGKKMVAEGDLISSDDGLYIPPASLIGFSDLQSCRYSFISGLEALDAVLEVPVLSEVPARAIQSLTDVEDWLTDGPAGILVSLAEAFNSAKASGLRFTTIKGSVWPLRKALTAPYLPCDRSALDTQLPALQWLSEALFLRFQRRASLPFDVLDSHLKMASEASGIPTWKLKRLLFGASLLQVLERRTAPYPVVVPGQRTVSHRIQQHGVLARISGMFSIHEQQDILSRLEPHESLRRLKSPNIDLSIGCLELQVSSLDKLMKIIEDFGLIQFSDKALNNPLEGVLHPTTQVSWVERIPIEERVTFWDPRSNSWVDEVAGQSAWTRGTLVKKIGVQRNTYWVKGESGFWSTDSSVWAWILRQVVQGAQLGTLYKNGDVSWTAKVHSLPSCMTKWWIHCGGGCIGIGEEQNLVFLGAQDQAFWGVVDPLESKPIRTFEDESKSLTRRALALKLRIRQQRKSNCY